MHTPPDSLEIADLRAFAILDNPLRLRILRLLDEPLTVRQVAESLQMPMTRLYYHVNLLLGSGFVKVVETRKAGALLEKIYQATARSFTPSKDLGADGLSPEEQAELAVNVVLNGARLDAQASLSEHFRRLAAGEAPDPSGFETMFRSIARLDEGARQQVEAKLKELLELVDSLDRRDGEGGTEYSLTCVMVPVAGWGS